MKPEWLKEVEEDEQYPYVETITGIFICLATVGICLILGFISADLIFAFTRIFTP